MTNITIPPEALEKAARAAYETPIPAASMIDDPPWENADPIVKEYFRWQARAASLAMLEAWPRMAVYDGCPVWHAYPHIILPLTENTNDKG